MTDLCPNADQHVDGPSGYNAWFAWAAAMSYRGYRQSRCSGCGLYTIWRGGRPADLIEEARRG